MNLIQYSSIAGFAVLGSAATSFGVSVSVPLHHFSYGTFDDATTLNFFVLKEAGVIADNPATPSGNNVDAIRLFSKTGGGNTQNDFTGIGQADFTDSVIAANGGPDPTSFDQDGDGTTDQEFNYDQFGNGSNSPTSRLWYGMTFSDGGSNGLDLDDTVDANSWSTGGELLDWIHAVHGADLDTPLFALDMNQTGADQDIWEKGRVVMVKDPDVNLTGKTADEIDSMLPGWLLNGTAVEFRLSDSADLFDEDGDGNPANGLVAAGSENPTDDAFVYTPGTFPADIDGDGIPDVVIDGNGAGNAADWGAFAAGLDLNDFLDYAFLTELQIKSDNNGFEEWYIVGGVDTTVIPVPAAVWGGMALLGGIGVMKKMRK
jgi:hypothetical protein